MRTLITILFLLFAVAPVEARPRTKLKYALVECTSWPWSGNSAAGTALRQLRKHVNGGKLRGLFRVLANGRLAMLEARYIGIANGKKVWSARGPKALGAALVAAGCTVIQYRDVLALPAAKRDWIKARSTCVGKATKNGKTLAVWPCSATGVTEIRVDGVAPLVMHGGSPYTVAGVSVP